MDAQFHRFLSDIAYMIPSDTQEIEGLDSVIKHLWAVAPATQLKLLSSRALLKKTVMKYGKDPETMNAMVDDCVRIHPIALSCLEDESRFPLDPGCDRLPALQNSVDGEGADDTEEAARLAPLENRGEQPPEPPEPGAARRGESQTLPPEQLDAPAADPRALHPADAESASQVPPPPLPLPDAEPRKPRQPRQPRCAARIAKLLITSYPESGPSVDWVVSLLVGGAPSEDCWIICHRFNRGYWLAEARLIADSMNRRVVRLLTPLAFSSLAEVCETIHPRVRDCRVRRAAVQIGIARILWDRDSMVEASLGIFEHTADASKSCRCKREPYRRRAAGPGVILDDASAPEGAPDSTGDDNDDEGDDIDDEELLDALWKELSEDRPEEPDDDEDENAKHAKEKTRFEVLAEAAAAEARGRGGRGDDDAPKEIHIADDDARLFGEFEESEMAAQSAAATAAERTEADVDRRARAASERDPFLEHAPHEAECEAILGEALEAHVVAVQAELGGGEHDVPPAAAIESGRVVDAMSRWANGLTETTYALNRLTSPEFSILANRGISLVLISDPDEDDSGPALRWIFWDDHVRGEGRPLDIIGVDGDWTIPYRRPIGDSRQNECSCPNFIFSCLERDNCEDFLGCQSAMAKQQVNPAEA